MKHNFFSPAILGMVFLVSLMVGCASPTPDPSIVWSDDFEDGDFEGWTDSDNVGVFGVEEGVLTALPKESGDWGMTHVSDVSTGTWSIDINLAEGMSGNYLIAVFSEDWTDGLGIYIGSGGANTSFFIATVNDGMPRQDNLMFTDKKYSGWTHIDITRDEQGISKYYLDQELVYEYQDDLALEAHWLSFDAPYTGPVLDNVVVRNRVMEFQP